VSFISTSTNLSPAISLDAEYAALREGAGFRLLDDRMIVRVTGDDRVSFFHGMCSADVKTAHTGDVVPALFLTEHAHVIGEFLIWVEEGALTLETELSAWPHEKEHLEKLLVADDVEMEEFQMSRSAVRMRSSRGNARNPSMRSSDGCLGSAPMRSRSSVIAWY
jgi:folate-binding Fe-S cluster repair protein YgfZ